MKEMLKRLGSALLAVAMVVGFLPGLAPMARAEEAKVQDGLKYEIVEDDGEPYVKITGYTEDLPADLIIPEKIGEYPVQQIGQSAFQQCTSLQSVVLPSTLLVIVDGAFYQCTNLSGIINIPEGVFYLGSAAFAQTGITKLTIPASTTMFRPSFAAECPNLERIEIAEGHPSLWNDQYGVVYTRNESGEVYLIAAPGKLSGEYVIPEDTYGIEGTAFWGCGNLEYVVISEGVGAIYWSAFVNCISLRSVAFPLSLTEIGNGVFEGCSSLSDFYYTGTEEQWNAIAFDKNAIPEGVTIHFDSKISEDEDLVYAPAEDGSAIIAGHPGEVPSELVIPETIDGTPVSSVGTGAFEGSSELTSLTVPASVEEIGESAFANCENLETVNLCGTNVAEEIGVEAMAFAFNVEEESGEIAPGLKRINGKAFYNCQKLKAVIIPDTVTFVGDEAFGGCVSLTDIYFAGTEEQWDAIAFGENAIPEGVTVHYQSAGHEHSWDDGVITKAPTCTEDGEMTYTCSCGETKTETIPATGHDWGDWERTKEPTCTEQGEDTKTCTVCGATETCPVGALGHNYEDVVTPPTETEQGYTTHTCTRCGDSYVDSYTDPIPTEPEPTETEPEPTDPVDPGFNNSFLDRLKDMFNSWLRPSKPSKPTEPTTPSEPEVTVPPTSEPEETRPTTPVKPSKPNWSNWFNWLWPFR